MENSLQRLQIETGVTLLKAACLEKFDTDENNFQKFGPFGSRFVA